MKCLWSLRLMRMKTLLWMSRAVAALLKEAVEAVAEQGVAVEGKQGVLRELLRAAAQILVQIQKLAIQPRGSSNFEQG